MWKDRKHQERQIRGWYRQRQLESLDHDRTVMQEEQSVQSGLRKG